LDHFGLVCEILLAQNLVVVSSDRCALTKEGMMLADTIAGMFTDHMRV
jgi:coproporphyrinogen III oxidase-like Fe-S oxidoreductase